MKTAIVTGASKGIGYATVKLLADSGYHVIAVSRNLSIFDTINIANVETYQLDITDSKQIKAFAEKYKDITLDLLVNNAGGGASPTKIINETTENFRYAYDVNVTGPMLLSQLFIPALQKSDSPTIIFVTSLGGKVPYRSGGNYTNAKRGEMALIDTMRLEFPEYNIKVTEICPGTVDTQKEKKMYGLNAKDIADIVLFIGSLPATVNINSVEVSHINSSKFG